MPTLAPGVFAADKVSRSRDEQLGANPTKHDWNRLMINSGLVSSLARRTDSIVVHNNADVAFLMAS